MSRLLATLLCSPSESSLWLRASALGRLMSAGKLSAGSACERSSLLSFVRPFLRLNRPDSRRWLFEELSLRPSSELRLLKRSRGPSWESPGASLPTDNAEVLALLDKALSAGAASD